MLHGLRKACIALLVDSGFQGLAPHSHQAEGRCLSMVQVMLSNGPDRSPAAQEPTCRDGTWPWEPGTDIQTIYLKYAGTREIQVK